MQESLPINFMGQRTCYNVISDFCSNGRGLKQEIVSGILQLRVFLDSGLIMWVYTSGLQKTYVNSSFGRLYSWLI